MKSCSLSLCLAAWAALIGFGGLLNRSGYAYKYPVTTEGCNVTDPALYANISAPVYDPATYRPQDHYRFVANLANDYEPPKLIDYHIMETPIPLWLTLKGD